MDALLRAFESQFRGQRYLHRKSTTGDYIASHLFEDLLTLGRSPKLKTQLGDGSLVVNTPNRIRGREGRRGDGTLGVLVPGASLQREPGFSVARGPVATLEIGAEVKIIATKLLAQIDRVMSDLRGQAEVFRTLNNRSIAVGIVGVNFADAYTGYEGEREHIAKAPPAREAPEVVRRLGEKVRPQYDEFIVLRFRATNRPPFEFSWLDEAGTRLDYSSALVRVSDAYDRRF